MTVTQIQLLLLLSSMMLVGGSDELRFLVLGDWGGEESEPYTNPYETHVSKSMGKIAQQLGTQFVIGLGMKLILLLNDELKISVFNSFAHIR